MCSSEVEQANPVWKIRPYREGDEHQLVALFTRVFKQPRTAEHWRWKFLGRPADFPTVWVAETEDGNLHGQYGCIPIRLKLHGEILPAVLGVEAMVDADLRRQGVYTALGTTAHAAWASAGRQVVIGLPNDKWGSTRAKLGYEHVCLLPWLRFPINAGAALARRGRLPAIVSAPAALAGSAGSLAWRAFWQILSSAQTARSGVQVKEVDTLQSAGSGENGKIEQIWSAVQGEYENALVRDSEWVRWRYLDAPGYNFKVLVAHSEGRPAGYLAYRFSSSSNRGAHTGYIADLFTSRKATAVASALVSAALLDLKRQGAETVVVTALAGSSLSSLLRRNGFLPASASFTFDVVPLNPSIVPSSLAHSKSWHLTAGDFDVI